MVPKCREARKREGRMDISCHGARRRDESHTALPPLARVARTAGGCTLSAPMFHRACRDPSLVVLLVGVALVSVPAVAHTRVSAADVNPHVAEHNSNSGGQTPALRPEPRSLKPVARSYANGNQLRWFDLARRPHDPLCTGDPATMPARCIDAQREMHWDEEDRLASVHGSDADMEFRYDADGERTHRVSLRRNDVTSYLSRFHSVRNGQFAMDHVFAGSERVATVMFNVPPAGGPGCDPTTGRTCIITHLPPGGGPPGTIGSPRTTLWYHTDHLQSTNYVTDARGRWTEHLEYFPFGEQWVEEQSGASSDTVPYRFTGHDWDSETRLYYAGARYYDPRQGQWLSGESLVASFRGAGRGSVYTPTHLGSYAYVINSPLVRFDPDGRQGIGVQLVVAGGGGQILPPVGPCDASCWRDRILSFIPFVNIFAFAIGVIDPNPGNAPTPTTVTEPRHEARAVVNTVLAAGATALPAVLGGAGRSTGAGPARIGVTRATPTAEGEETVRVFTATDAPVNLNRPPGPSSSGGQGGTFATTNDITTPTALARHTQANVPPSPSATRPAGVPAHVAEIEIPRSSLRPDTTDPRPGNVWIPPGAPGARVTRRWRVTSPDDVVPVVTPQGPRQ